MNPHLTLWGVSLFSSLSLSSSFLRAFLYSVLFNKFTIAAFFNGPFFSFNLSRQVYIRTTSLLCFIQSVLLYSLPPHPLPWFWNVWQTLRVALLSKKLFCYRLEINPRENICMETSVEKNVYMKYRCRLKQAWK